MITYEEIRKANESIHTTDIKGKLYAEVNQRIKAFRMVYPHGFIITEMLSNGGGVCVFKATVGTYDMDADGEAYILGTGTAYEQEGSTFINKTSYIENCETSAVGRALGMAGFGIDTSVASAEEVQNAIINQQASENIDSIKVDALIKRCTGDGVSVDALCNLYKVIRLKDLTMKQYSHINLNWDKIKGGIK